MDQCRVEALIREDIWDAKVMQPFTEIMYIDNNQILKAGIQI